MLKYHTHQIKNIWLWFSKITHLNFMKMKIFFLKISDVFQNDVMIFDEIHLKL